MKQSCSRSCRLKEMIANLQCPKCFSAEVTLCDEEGDDEGEEKAACEACGCRFSFNSGIPRGGMD